MDNANSQIHEGMHVVDLAGDKIGTVARVGGDASEAVAAEDGEAVGRDMEAKRAGRGATGHIEVRTPGHDLYIPFSAINQVHGDTVSIIVSKAAVETQGWDRAPRTA